MMFRLFPTCVTVPTEHFVVCCAAEEVRDGLTPKVLVDLAL
jgi:hypothetical protein